MNRIGGKYAKIRPEVVGREGFYWYEPAEHRFQHLYVDLEKCNVFAIWTNERRLRYAVAGDRLGQRTTLYFKRSDGTMLPVKELPLGQQPGPRLVFPGAEEPLVDRDGDPTASKFSPEEVSRHFAASPPPIRASFIDLCE